MAKYVYPAVFTPQPDGSYSIVFPDLENCFTCGSDLANGIEMAEDALALLLYGYETDGKEIPAPSIPADFTLSNSAFVNYIACDTLEYRKRFNSKAVKKTLSIPEWLNEAAVSNGINFSQVLQEALMQKLMLK